MRRKLPLSVHLREREIAGGKIQLYLDITRNGKRWKEATHQILLPETSRIIKKKNEEARYIAETMRKEREAQLNDEILGIQRQGTGYLDSFYTYFEHCMTEYEGSGTLQMWKSCLAHIKVYESRTDLVFADITKEWVVGFRDYLEKSANVLRDAPVDADEDWKPKRLAQNTACTLYQKLVCVMNKAITDRLITFNPCDGVKGIARLDSKRQFLSKEELASLFATPFHNRVIKDSFLFSCVTGLRFSDVASLTWKEIENINGKTMVATRMDKPDKMIYVPLNSIALKLIGICGEPNDLVFPGLNHNRSVNRAINTWAKRAGLKKHITFHCARHTFATQLLTNDVDIYTTSKLLGHTNISTTQIYAKIVDEKKQKAVDALDGLIEL